MRWVKPILARLRVRSKNADLLQLELYPQPFTFLDTEVGQSKSQDLRFTARGGTLVVSEIQCKEGSFAPFTVPGNAFELSAGAHKNVPIGFRPEIAGQVSRTLNIHTNEAQPWTEFVISGTGLAVGDIVVTPATLSFGVVKIGERPTKTFTVENVGGKTLVVAGIQFELATSVFIVDTSGPVSLAPGEKRLVTVTFAPNSRPIETRRLVITSDDPDEPTSYVQVEGRGPGGRIELSPTALEFGDVPIGASRQRKLVCRNTGDEPLTLTRMSTRHAHYQVSPRAPLTVAAGGSVDLFVTLTPPDRVDGGDTLTIESNDPDRRSVAVSLRGRVVWAGCELSPELLRFGGVDVGDTATRDLIILNSGALWLDVDEASIVDGSAGTGPFAIPSFAPFSVEPGERSGILVTFSPTLVGDFYARLDLVTNAHKPPPSPEMSGSSGTAIAITPASLEFGWVPLGTKKRRAVSISNIGSTLLRVTGAVVAPVSGASLPFVLDPFVPFTLQPRSSKQLWVAFQPSVEDEHSAALVITSNDPKRPTVSVPLTGFGRSQNPESPTPTSRRTR